MSGDIYIKNYGYFTEIFVSKNFDIYIYNFVRANYSPNITLCMEKFTIEISPSVIHARYYDYDKNRLFIISYNKYLNMIKKLN